MSRARSASAVLDVEVGPVLLVRTLGAAHELADLDLLSVDEHAIELLDGGVGGLGGLVVDVAVTLGVAGLGIAHDLAGEDVAEEGEGVVQLLVVDGLVQVLDEDVADVGAAEAGVALAPHDAAGAVLDLREVHGVEGALGVGEGVVVDVAVAEGAAGDGVAADTDGRDGADGVEDLEEEALVGVGGQVADVQRRGLETGGVGGRGGAGGTGRGGRRSLRLGRGSILGSGHVGK